jgi:hypothetical protein
MQRSKVTFSPEPKNPPGTRRNLTEGGLSTLLRKQGVKDRKMRLFPLLFAESS